MTYRTYKRHLTAADRRAKVIIEACVKSGAGIDQLEDAPNFRYTPAQFTVTSFKGRERCKPSGRGSVSIGGNPLKLKTWTPSKLSLAPQYDVPMRGDSQELTDARREWLIYGDPGPLRELLAKQADERRKARPSGGDSAEQLELAA